MIKRYSFSNDSITDVTQDYFDQLERMKSLFMPLRDIRQFHEKFGLEYNGPPRELPAELKKFRVKFMGEELCEYISDNERFHQAVQSTLANETDMRRQPLEKQFDALVDLVYVALGTAYLQGFDFLEAWNRVHEANMAKVRALREDDSKRGSTYDVVKPEGWRPPDLSDLVIDTTKQS